MHPHLLSFEVGNFFEYIVEGMIDTDVAPRNACLALFTNIFKTVEPVCSLSLSVCLSIMSLSLSHSPFLSPSFPLYPTSPNLYLSPFLALILSPSPSPSPFQMILAPFLHVYMLYTCSALSHISETVRKSGVAFFNLAMTSHSSQMWRFFHQMLPSFYSILHNRRSAITSTHSKATKGADQAKKKKKNKFSAKDENLAVVSVKALAQYLSLYPRKASPEDVFGVSLVRDDDRSNTTERNTNSFRPFASEDHPHSFVLKQLAVEPIQFSKGPADIKEDLSTALKKGKKVRGKKVMPKQVEQKAQRPVASLFKSGEDTDLALRTYAELVFPMLVECWIEALPEGSRVEVTTHGEAPDMSDRKSLGRQSFATLTTLEAVLCGLEKSLVVMCDVDRLERERKENGMGMFDLLGGHKEQEDEETVAAERRKARESYLSLILTHVFTYFPFKHSSPQDASLAHSMNIQCCRIMTSFLSQSLENTFMSQVDWCGIILEYTAECFTGSRSLSSERLVSLLSMIDVLIPLLSQERRDWLFDQFTVFYTQCDPLSSEKKLCLRFISKQMTSPTCFHLVQYPYGQEWVYSISRILVQSGGVDDELNLLLVGLLNRFGQFFSGEQPQIDFGIVQKDILAFLQLEELPREEGSENEDDREGREGKREMEEDENDEEEDEEEYEEKKERERENGTKKVHLDGITPPTPVRVTSLLDEPLLGDLLNCLFSFSSIHRDLIVELASIARHKDSSKTFRTYIVDIVSHNRHRVKVGDYLSFLLSVIAPKGETDSRDLSLYLGVSSCVSVWLRSLDITRKVYDLLFPLALKAMREVASLSPSSFPPSSSSSSSSTSSSSLSPSPSSLFSPRDIEVGSPQDHAWVTSIRAASFSSVLFDFIGELNATGVQEHTGFDRLSIPLWDAIQTSSSPFPSLFDVLLKGLVEHEKSLFGGVMSALSERAKSSSCSDETVSSLLYIMRRKECHPLCRSHSEVVLSAYRSIVRHTSLMVPDSTLVALHSEVEFLFGVGAVCR